MPTSAIPRIDIAALFGDDPGARDAVDQAILLAARQEGMLVITGLPDWAVLDAPARRALLRIFTLPEAEIRRLWRWNFDPRQPNVYRGWFPAQPGLATYKEGIDIGPDLVHGAQVVDAQDPLREASPLPPEAALPGWQDQARSYYRAMTRLALALMHAIARGLGLPQDCFDAAFEPGVSTLRLLRYPVRPAGSLDGVAPEEGWATHEGQRREMLARAHVDSGFITLLAQDGVAGLQAQHRDGHWIDVPPLEGSLAVNFGRVLELWTGGLVRATPHRVLGTGQERFSIPFFFEASVDAVIAPLPLPEAQPFAPFYFGDHLWAVTTRFVEQRGIAHLRTPRGTPPAAAAA